MPGVARSVSAGPSNIRRANSVPSTDERPCKRLKTDASAGSTIGEEKKNKRSKKKKKVPVVQSEADLKEMEGSREPAASGFSSKPVSAMLVKLETGTPEPAVASGNVQPKVSLDGPYSEHTNGFNGNTETIPTHSPPKPGSSNSLPDFSTFLATTRNVGCNGKGKEKAVDTQELENANTQLTDELSAKSKLLSQHTSLLGQLQQSLTCQICLDLLHKPYALAPCGHVACYSCLIRWFSAEGPEHDRPAIFRPKKCPHCRAVVRERPAMVWAIKEMVGMVVRSGLAEGVLPSPDEAAEPAQRDPWSGIFRSGAGMGGLPVLPQLTHMFPGGPMPLAAIPMPHPAPNPQNMGVLDEEDGGVYRCMDCLHEIAEGACTHCGRVYLGHGYNHAHFLDSEGDGDFAEFGDDSDDDYEEDGASLFGLPPLGWLPVVDEDSGDDSQADEDEEPPMRYALRAVEDEDDEEGYESSFIDDDDAPRQDGNGRSSPADVRARSGAPAPEGFYRNPSPSQSERASRSSAEDAQDGPSGLSSGPSRRRGRAVPTRIIDSDDESDKENQSQSDLATLADRVAAREREMYGDDGSVHHPSTQHEYNSRLASDESDYGSSEDEDDDSQRRGWSDDESVLEESGFAWDDGSEQDFDEDVGGGSYDDDYN